MPTPISRLLLILKLRTGEIVSLAYTMMRMFNVKKRETKSYPPTTPRIENARNYIAGMINNLQGSVRYGGLVTTDKIIPELRSLKGQLDLYLKECGYE
jgi:hypothetical protein